MNFGGLFLEKSNNSNLYSISILHDYVGDDSLSCIEDLLINHYVVLNDRAIDHNGIVVDGEFGILELCELEASAQDGVDLKFRILRAIGKQAFVWTCLVA